MGYNKPIPSAPSASNFSFINRNITYNNNYQWPQQPAPRVSNLKAILAQSVAALPIFLINFNTAAFFIFVFSVSTFELLTQYSRMHIIGLLVGGITAQIIGGRLTIILGAIALVGGWSIFKWVSSMTVLIWTVRVVGLVSGMMKSPSYVYLAEIAQPNARGALMATVNLSSTIGLFYSQSITHYLSFSIATFKWINLIFPIIGFIMMIIVPESPQWLANKGRYQRAESSLAWFRGWTSTLNVRSESTEIIDHAQNNRSVLKLFGKSSFYISLLVSSYVFAIKAFSGIEYLSLILLSLPLPDNINFPLILNYADNLAPIVFLVAVAMLSKRILILTSLFCGSLALAAVIIFNILNHEKIISTKLAYWLLPSCLILGIIFLHFGLGHVPFLLNGELFPSRLRYVGAGVGLCIMNGLEYGSRSIYRDYVMSPPFTFNTLFSMFVCINFFGFLTLCYLFPKNQNKSIVEIEKSCTSINNLRSKVNGGIVFRSNIPIQTPSYF